MGKVPGKLWAAQDQVTWKGSCECCVHSDTDQSRVRGQAAEFAQLQASVLGVAAAEQKVEWLYLLHWPEEHEAGTGESYWQSEFYVSGSPVGFLPHDLHH